MTRRSLILKSILIFCAALSHSACTKTQKQTPDLITRTKLTSIEFQNVTSLEIAKTDPTQSQNWHARLERQTQTDASQKNTPSTLKWEIKSTLSKDTWAQSNLIDHLLDALSSGEIKSISPETALSSVGLDPPHYSFRVSTPTITEEIYLGEEIPQSDARWVAFSKNGPAMQARGAFNRMIGHISKESDLREPRIFGFDLARVQKISVTFSQSKPSSWNAERRSGQWIVSNNPIKNLKEFEESLDHLLHFRVSSFEESLEAPKDFETDKSLSPIAVIKIQAFREPLYEVHLYSSATLEKHRSTQQPNALSHSSALSVFIPTRNRMIFDAPEALLSVLNDVSKHAK